MAGSTRHFFQPNMDAVLEIPYLSLAGQPKAHVLIVTQETITTPAIGNFARAELVVTAQSKRCVFCMCRCMGARFCLCACLFFSFSPLSLSLSLRVCVYVFLTFSLDSSVVQVLEPPAPVARWAVPFSFDSYLLFLAWLFSHNAGNQDHVEGLLVGLVSSSDS